MTDWTMTEAQDELVADLTEAGYTVIDYVPRGRFETPLVVLSADEPYLQPGDTYDTWLLRLQVFLVLDETTDQEFPVAVAQGVAQLTNAIDPHQWDVRDLSAPFKARNLGNRPALRVRLSTDISIPSTT